MPSIATFLAGQTLTADLLNSLVDDLNDLTGWVTTSADFPKTNTTVTAVTGLVVPLDANSNYVIEGVFYVDGPTAGDCKFNTTNPAGSTGTHSIEAADTAASTAFNALNLGIVTLASGSSIVVGTIGAGTTLKVRYYAEVVTTNAGNYQMTFAQNAASGTSKCLAGSRLRAVKRP